MRRHPGPARQLEQRKVATEPRFQGGEAARHGVYGHGPSMRGSAAGGKGRRLAARAGGPKNAA